MDRQLRRGKKRDGKTGGQRTGHDLPHQWRGDRGGGGKKISRFSCTGNSRLIDWGRRGEKGESERMSVDFIIGQEEKEIAGHTTDKEYIWDHSFFWEKGGQYPHQSILFEFIRNRLLH